jgi:hypothetical protein
VSGESRGRSGAGGGAGCTSEVYEECLAPQTSRCFDLHAWTRTCGCGQKSRRVASDDRLASAASGLGLGGQARCSLAAPTSRPSGPRDCTCQTPSTGYKWYKRTSARRAHAATVVSLNPQSLSQSQPDPAIVHASMKHHLLIQLSEPHLPKSTFGTGFRFQNTSKRMSQVINDIVHSTRNQANTNATSDRIIPICEPY